MAGFSGFFFSHQRVAEQWQAKGLVPGAARIAIVPELSSPFAGVPQRDAQQRLGATGNPLFLWSGRLHPVKDPLTTLSGLQQVFQKWPEARLLMAFRTQEMLPQVESFIRDHCELDERVQLLGEVPHADMELLFSAADFFVQSSVREYGSNSLIEALSCGAIPVVSEIPSFKALTAKLPAAIHFPVGDARSMAYQLIDFDLKNLRELRTEIKASFDTKLSYPALATVYNVMFKELTRELAGR